ncbi:MAG: YbjQ family protein, partial [Archaeoglobaceae archaeon]
LQGSAERFAQNNSGIGEYILYDEKINLQVSQRSDMRSQTKWGLAFIILGFLLLPLFLPLTLLYSVPLIAIGLALILFRYGKDISALFKNIVGGEIQEYTEMLSEARKEALNRMIKNAKELGADAVLNVRFATSQTMAGAAELLAYGTAVKLKKKY